MNNLQEKKNAFRSMIRQDQIQKYFAQKRKAFHSQRFVEVSEVDKDLKEVLQELPRAIIKLTNLADNQPQKVCEYLYENMKQFLNSFIQVTMSECFYYMHIIEKMIIRECSKSERKQELIEKTLCPVLHNCQNFLQTSRIVQCEILKYCFDYLMALGANIQLIRNVQLGIVIGFIKHAFIKLDISENEQTFCTILIVISNILSISKENLLREEYDVEFLKRMLIGGLFENPSTLRNLIQMGINTDSTLLTEQILRVFVNLTFIISGKQEIQRLMPLISVYLLQTIKIHLKKATSIPILLMRFIHNLNITDVSLMEKLDHMNIIDEMLLQFSKEPEVLREFWVSQQLISFFHSYIKSVGQSSQKVEMLIQKRMIHQIIMEKIYLNSINQCFIVEGLQTLLLLIERSKYLVIQDLKEHFQFFDELLMNKNKEIQNYSQEIINILSNKKENDDDDFD